MSKMHITYILLQLITVTSIVQWKNTTSAKQLADQQPPATKAKQVSISQRNINLISLYLKKSLTTIPINSAIKANLQKQHE